MEKFIAYTNLLRAYAAEQDQEKKDDIKYQLMLLDADFKPVFSGETNE